jgi:hypothetical protein
MSRVLSLAGFQVTFIGRFWVITEEEVNEALIAYIKRKLDKPDGFTKVGDVSEP